MKNGIKFFLNFEHLQFAQKNASWLTALNLLKK